MIKLPYDAPTKTPIVIAVDGPTAAGKGTLARMLAAELGFNYLDTGSLYRAIAWTMLERGADPKDQELATEVARALDIEGIEDALLRTSDVAEAASIVAAFPPVRAEILDFQRRYARKRPGAVVDGRDIGTVVCPDAEVKLFVTASPETRANRRFLELIAKGETISEPEVLADVKARDERDTSRADSPLKPAEDAHLLDTSNLSIEAAFRAAMGLIHETLSR